MAGGLGGLGTENKLFLLVDLDVTGDEKLDVLNKKTKRLTNGLGMAEGAFSGFNTEQNKAADNADNVSGQFGKMFGIGMNVMFMGMAISQVFGRMGRSMLELTGASSALGAAMKTVLLPFFIQLTPYVLELSKALMNMPRSFKMIIGATVALLTVVGPLLFALGQLSLLAVSGLSLGMVATAAAVAAGGLAILWAGLEIGIALGNRFGDEISFAMDLAGTVITRFVDTSMKMLGNFMKILKNIVLFVANVFTLQFGDAFGNLENIFSAVIDNIRQLLRQFFITDIAQFVAEGASNIINGIKNVLPSWVVEGLKMVGNGVSSIAGGAMDVIGMNDFVVTDGGKIIKPHKNDTLIGTKNPGQLGGSGGGEVTVNINDPVMNDEVDVQSVVDEVEERVNRNTRGRSGGLS